MIFLFLLAFMSFLIVFYTYLCIVVFFYVLYFLGMWLERRTVDYSVKSTEQWYSETAWQKLWDHEMEPLLRCVTWANSPPCEVRQIQKKSSSCLGVEVHSVVPLKIMWDCFGCMCCNLYNTFSFKILHVGVCCDYWQNSYGVFVAPIFVLWRDHLPKSLCAGPKSQHINCEPRYEEVFLISM